MKKDLPSGSASRRSTSNLHGTRPWMSELKKLKANIREVEKQKDEMIAAARAKITEDEAKRLILERFQRLLTEQFDGYLRQYQRAFIAAVENLWQKYAVTTKQILAERDREAAQLNAFLEGVGV